MKSSPISGQIPKSLADWLRTQPGCCCKMLEEQAVLCRDFRNYLRAVNAMALTIEARALGGETFTLGCPARGLRNPRAQLDLGLTAVASGPNASLHFPPFPDVFDWRERYVRSRGVLRLPEFAPLRLVLAQLCTSRFPTTELVSAARVKRARQGAPLMQVRSGRSINYRLLADLSSDLLKQEESWQLGVGIHSPQLFCRLDGKPLTVSQVRRTRERLMDAYCAFEGGGVTPALLRKELSPWIGACSKASAALHAHVNDAPTTGAHGTAVERSGSSRPATAEEA
jgi:hypothetical protein